MVGGVGEALSLLGNFRVDLVALGSVGGCAASGVICADSVMAAMESARGTRRLRKGILITLRRFRESQGWV